MRRSFDAHVDDDSDDDADVDDDDADEDGNEDEHVVVAFVSVACFASVAAHCAPDDCCT